MVTIRRILDAPREAVHARRAALALAAASALVASCAKPAERPNVLLIVVDTLRADHVTPLSPESGATPRLAEFARNAARFTHAQTPRAKTTPAVSSLLTGLYPHEHGVRDLSMRLDGGVPVLAEAFTRGGYTTVGIVGNYVLTDARSGLARGFRMWVEDLPDSVGVPPNDAPQRRAESLTDAALVAFGLEAPPERSAPGPHLAAIDVTDASERWFTYLHYMDPHGAYDPPAEHAVAPPAAGDPIPAEDELAEHAIHDRRVADYNVPSSARLADGRADAAQVRALYEGEVRYVDAEIGRLLDRLGKAGLLENTLVVITADHGESLGEHRYWFEHGFYTYEATCRVPLLIAGPGVRARDIDADVSLVDLAPTLLELCDLPALRPVRGSLAGSPRGRSRAGVLAGGDAPGSHPVFSEKIERQDLSHTIQAKAVRLGDWKLIRRYTHLDPAGGQRREPLVLSEELYDLARDPSEERDLAATPPDAAPLDRMRAELVRFADADVRFADLAQELQRQRERLEREDPETVRILEALGY